MDHDRRHELILQFVTSFFLCGSDKCSFVLGKLLSCHKGIEVKHGKLETYPEVLFPLREVFLIEFESCVKLGS